MRKYVVGLIVGVALMYAGQAAADSFSKIGKRVQGEYAVKVDGVELGVKALAIDGQTTVPARALANAVGYDVAFINKEVVLTKPEVPPVEEEEVIEEPVAPPEVPAPVDEPETEPEYTLETVNRLINGIEAEIHGFKPLYERMIVDGASQEQLEKWEKFFVDKEAEIERLKAIKAELESK